MSGPAPSDTRHEARFVHREVVVLVAVCAIAVLAFVGTRAAAAANRAQRVRDAATWYATGSRELAAGHPAQAVSAFRHAAAIDRESRDYRLALAGALGANHQDEEARQVLLAVRESKPEDPDVNLRLARLEAQLESPADAMRYYQNAIYGVWHDRPAEARLVRIELVKYLLAHQRREEAVAELLALSSNLADDPASLSDAGQLFLEAGEPRHALDQFQRALRTDARFAPALAGAGEAAFAAGDYPGALRYLQSAPSSPATAELRETAELVLSLDPLRPRLPFAERRSRLARDFSHVVEAFEHCPPAADDADGAGELRAELAAAVPAMKPERLRSIDDLESGVALLYRGAQAVARACGPPTPFDRALLIIGRRDETGLK